MNAPGIVLTISWAAGFTSIIAGLLLSDVLFKDLKRKYPKYYKLLGSPEVNIIGQKNIFLHPELRSGAAFFYLLAFRGIPKNFPSDNRLRRLAYVLRLVGVVLILSFITFFVISWTTPT